MLAGFRAIHIRYIMAMAVLVIFSLSGTVWAGASGSYPKASYNGLIFPSYSLSGAIIDKSREDDDWTRTLNWNGRLEPGGVLRIAGTAKREGGSGPGVVNGRLKVTVEVDGVASKFNKDLIGNDQVVSFDVSRPIGPSAREGRVLVEFYGIYGNGQTRNIKLGGVFTNPKPISPPVAQTQPANKPPQNSSDNGGLTAWADREKAKREKEKDLRKLQNMQPAEIQTDVTRNRTQTSGTIVDNSPIGKEMKAGAIFGSVDDGSDALTAGKKSNVAIIEHDLFFNGNDYGVGVGGKAPWFTLASPTTVTYLWSYHWNGGQGAPRGGTLSLRDSQRRILGTWPATVVNRVYWEVRPKVHIPAGRYQIVDSEPATWAQNAGSQGFGHARVKGYEE